MALAMITLSRIPVAARPLAVEDEEADEADEEKQEVEERLFDISVVQGAAITVVTVLASELSEPFT